MKDINVFEFNENHTIQLINMVPHASAQIWAIGKSQLFQNRDLRYDDGDSGRLLRLGRIQPV
jgi:hypothetical protein